MTRGNGFAANLWVAIAPVAGALCPFRSIYALPIAQYTHTQGVPNQIYLKQKIYI
ncbi:hypothetical protein [Thermoleptolyngbya sp. C42_A2020_037]|uniref:hypothetical protein n=1 Tax=Thermoleptolyngbya sp. C42_A2020_037 TaxID=2747799 RepID=UPI0019DE638F|nr:hypothetical protein [Thermoleptolyngbya sp. C42_A2020_037]MBF2083521.1 hypothetical protein [Thermoleptolyngbya sp. C42_A2020_037]